MPKLKSLIIGKVKDKASIGKAKLFHSFSSRAVKHIHLALLRSTTHTSHKPPNSNYVSAVISYSNDRHGPAAFAATLWRLRVTKDAFVAIKSLIVYHNLIKSSRDVLDGGLKNLQLNDFSDTSSNLTLELSQWVRWYGQYLNSLSFISKVLGSFPSLTDSSKEKAKERDCVSSYQTGYVMRQTDTLVTFFEYICTRPEKPLLYQNKIVDEIRELVIQDYFTVMRLVIVRLQVLSERLIKPGFGNFGSTDLRSLLLRIEECRTSLSALFWCYRRLADDFWCLVEKLKAETGKPSMELVEEVRSVQVMVKVIDDNTEMVEFPGSVQEEWVTFDDFEMAKEEVVRYSSRWVTFDDDSEMVKDEGVKWNLEWETFDDSNRLMNLPTCISNIGVIK